MLKDVITQLAYIEASLVGIKESMTYLQEECSALAVKMHSEMDAYKYKQRQIKNNEIKLLETLFELPVKGSLGDPRAKNCSKCKHGCDKCSD